VCILLCLFSPSSKHASCFFSARCSESDTFLSNETKGSAGDAPRSPLGGKARKGDLLPNSRGGKRQATQSERPFGENGVSPQFATAPYR
jgi:hypothetical protein